MKDFEYTKEDLQEFRKLAEQAVPYGYAMLSELHRLGYSPLEIAKDEEQAYEHAKKAYEAERVYDFPEELSERKEHKKGYGHYALGVCLLEGVGIEKDIEKGIFLIKESAVFGNPYGQNILGNCYEEGLGVEKNERIAADCFERAADQGNAGAQFNLGLCHDNGIGVAKDEREAFKWYKAAAEQGYVEAQNSIGICYENGIGIEKDEGMAIYWYSKAAEQGYEWAQLNLGFCYENGTGINKNDEEAFACYKKAAKQGNMEAERNLGTCYYYGRGVEKNKKKAIECFEKSASGGNVEAQNNLAACYHNGQGVLKNKKEAFMWYKKAAEQGNASAQASVGMYYRNGWEVERDYKQAFRWFADSAAQGNARAQCNLGLCYNNGWEVDKDERKALYWYRKAAEQGNSEAQNNMGICYDNGIGIEKDEGMAIYWYRKAAERGNKDAKFNLEKCYAMSSREQHGEMNIEFYKELAKQGDAEAQFNLGVYYASGIGTKQDIDKAIYFLKQAAEQGNTEAQLNLGLCYENGFGVEKSEKKATKYYAKAKGVNYNIENYSFTDFYSGNRERKIFKLSKDYLHQQDSIVYLLNELIKDKKNIFGVMICDSVNDETGVKRALISQQVIVLPQKENKLSLLKEMVKEDKKPLYSKVWDIITNNNEKTEINILKEEIKKDKLQINLLRQNGLKSYLKIAKISHVLLIEMALEEARSKSETGDFVVLGTLDLVDHLGCIAITVEGGKLLKIDVFSSLQEFDIEDETLGLLKETVIEAFKSENEKTEEYQDDISINQWRPYVTKTGISSCSVCAIKCVEEIAKKGVRAQCNMDGRNISLNEEKNLRLSHSEILKNNEFIVDKEDLLSDLTQQNQKDIIIGDVRDQMIDAFNILQELSSDLSGFMNNYGCYNYGFPKGKSNNLHEQLFWGRYENSKIFSINMRKEEKPTLLTLLPDTIIKGKEKKLANPVAESLVASPVSESLKARHGSETALQTTHTLREEKPGINFGTVISEGLELLEQRLKDAKEETVIKAALEEYVGDLKGKIESWAEDRKKPEFERTEENLEREIDEWREAYNAYSAVKNGAICQKIYVSRKLRDKLEEIAKLLFQNLSEINEALERFVAGAYYEMDVEKNRIDILERCLKLVSLDGINQIDQENIRKGTDKKWEELENNLEHFEMKSLRKMSKEDLLELFNKIDEIVPKEENDKYTTLINERRIRNTAISKITF